MIICISVHGLRKTDLDMPMPPIFQHIMKTPEGINDGWIHKESDKLVSAWGQVKFYSPVKCSASVGAIVSNRF